MRGPLTRTSRYLAAIGGLALTSVLLVALAYGATESERADIEGDSARLSDIRDAAVAYTDTIRDQEAALLGYLLTREQEAIDVFEQSVVLEAELGASFRAAAADLPGVREAGDDLSAFAAEWRETFAEPVVDAVRLGDFQTVAQYTRQVQDVHEAIDEAVDPIDMTLHDAELELRDRTDTLAVARAIATALGLAAMLIAAFAALTLMRRYGRVLELDAMRASVLNRFTELTSFATEDRAIAAANLEALSLLSSPDAAVSHILNRSKDRAVPEATIGEPVAEVLTLHALSDCVGLKRGSMYVTTDAAAPLSVRCPVYPIESGTLACVPLTSGETVGVVHLYWQQAGALPLDLRSSVVRIAEHAALAIGNRRLLTVLRGQADTDARTGLANNRAFDRALEAGLAARQPEEHLSVLMIDLDHFKDFNDRYGHPAGDEALRVFGGVLRLCMRDGDLAARYGGEEFAVLLSGVDATAAAAIAERIRARTESTVISSARARRPGSRLRSASPRRPGREPIASRCSRSRMRRCTRPRRPGETRCCRPRTSSPTTARQAGRRVGGGTPPN
jgi:diguanylate cyclase (GGDEF)-like protein